MAEISIATSPSLVSSTFSDTVTTAPFEAEVETLLVATVIGVNLGEGAPSVSGGSLSWTRRVQRSFEGVYAEIWTAPCANGATGITVTASLSDAFALALKVDVVTGADLSAPVGQTGTGSTTTNNATITGYTSSKAGSRGFCAAAEINNLGTPTSTDDESAFASTISGMAVRKASNTASAGTAVMFNLDAAGSSSADWQWAAAEILPGSIDATKNLATVDAEADVHNVSVSTGHKFTLDTVDAAADVHEVGVSTGHGLHPSTVVVSAAVPTVVVSAGEIEIVHLPSIVAAAAVPELGVSSGHTLTVGGVAAAADVLEVTIDAQRQSIVDMPAVLPSTLVPAPTVSVPVLPGDRITQAGQIEWNGFLMGAGTSYQILALDGWFGLPPSDSGNVPRPSGHGAFPGRPQGAERIINLLLQVKALPEDFERLIQDLEGVGGLPDDETELPIVIRMLSTPYLVYGSLKDRTPGQVDRHFGLGLTRNMAIQWVCSDPRRYSLIRHGVTIDVDDPTEIINAGNTSTQPEIRIHGPVENPVLTVEETGHTLAFNLEVEADSRLDVDVKAGTATVGQTSVSGKVVGSVPLTDWVLRPGISTISYTADGGGGNGVDIFWRDAWT